MDLLIGQAVTAISDAEVFDGQGRPVGAVSAGTQLRISGARKFIIAQGAEHSGQWFWAYPVAAEGQPSIVGWVRETDLRPAFGVPYVGALSDVTLPGIVFPPYGVYQALRGHEPGRGGGAEPPSGGEPIVPWSGVAKLAIIAGGALAVYLIYVATKSAAKTQEHVGYATGRYLGARYGRGDSERPMRLARATILPPEPKALPRAPIAAEARPTSESTRHPLLGAYESYSL